jgi:hypothetical protein
MAAVILCGPVVSNVTMNVPVPLVIVMGVVTVAALSLVVIVAVPEPPTGLPFISTRSTVPGWATPA